MTNHSGKSQSSSQSQSSSPSSTPGKNPSLADDTTTVAQLKVLVREFVNERNWQRFHNPKNLAMSLAIETGELLEHFQWLTMEEATAVKDQPKAKHDVEEELSDCLAYIIAIANTMDIDLSESLRKKMIRNAAKYPANATS
jgi:NTP pyrophosphatase (non-canonical NTP hydrolase)